MESDPLLALAEDARTFGNCHKRTPRSAPSSSEVLATMAAHFKTALERARQQIHLSNQQNRVLVNEAKTKDRLVSAEQLTSSKLLEVRVRAIFRGHLRSILDHLGSNRGKFLYFDLNYKFFMKIIYRSLIFI